MAINNVKHKLSASSRSVINSGLTDDYRQAIVEYIWNGFDAEAKIVNVQYQKADDLGNLAYLTISDDGKGIKKDMLDYTFGQFLDSQKRQTYQRTSDVHGKKGKGRFSFQNFACRAEWTTRYLDQQDQLKEYTISIDVQDLSSYETTEERTLDKDVYSTGTEVRFINLHDISVNNLEHESFFEYLEQQFAWFLYLKEAQGIVLKINGTVMAYEEIIADSDDIPIDIENSHFDVTYIRWNKKISDKFYFYMMNSNLNENFKTLTSFNNKTTGFYHSIYVKSAYFDNFEYEENPSERYDGVRNQADGVYKTLQRKLKKILEEKEKGFVQEVASVKLVNGYERDGILPHFKQDIYDQSRKQDLIETIKQIYYIQPKIFNGLNDDQSKTLVAFLNILLSSDEREKILGILEDIVTLTDEERRGLYEVLKTTSIRNISKVANMMHNRLVAIERLKLLVNDLGMFTTERDHIQRIMEKCFWLFGEQFNLVSADVTFEKALANYIYVLDVNDKPDDVTIDNVQRNRRPDIFLARKRMVNDANTSSMLEDNIIVELKRPSIDIGIKEYRQIEDYFRLIKNDPKFNAQSRIWKFFVVGKTLDKDVTDKYDSFKMYNKRYLVNIQDRYEIYALTWDDLFKEFEYRHKYILEKLNFDNEAIQQEIEQVKRDVSGANQLTQEMLSLEY